MTKMMILGDVIRQRRLAGLNSLTKYPSIKPLHGRDVDTSGERSGPPPAGAELIAREQIDGVNARVVLLDSGAYRRPIFRQPAYVGSRNELLAYSEDLLFNPSMGIVEALAPFVTRLRHFGKGAEGTCVAGVCCYFEVYGGKTTGAAREYGGPEHVGCVLLDVMELPGDLATAIEGEPATIAAWRDAGGQEFYGESQLVSFAAEHDLPMAPLREFYLPDWESEPAAAEALRDVTWTNLGVNAKGRAEGVVVRTPDRSWITKVKHRDYRKSQR